MRITRVETKQTYSDCPVLADMRRWLQVAFVCYRADKENYFVRINY